MKVRLDEAKVGDAVVGKTFPPITRETVARYAEASGDHNPLHLDGDFARQAGFPEVFSHGMLSMGATGRVITDWFGAENVRHYGVRFVNQVWPGDALTATVAVTALREVDGEQLADLSVETVNQDGAPVVVGSATVLLAP